MNPSTSVNRTEAIAIPAATIPSLSPRQAARSLLALLFRRPRVAATKHSVLGLSLHQAVVPDHSVVVSLATAISAICGVLGHWIGWRRGHRRGARTQLEAMQRDLKALMGSVDELKASHTHSAAKIEELSGRLDQMVSVGRFNSLVDRLHDHRVADF